LIGGLKEVYFFNSNKIVSEGFGKGNKDMEDSRTVKEIGGGGVEPWKGEEDLHTIYKII